MKTLKYIIIATVVGILSVTGFYYYSQHQKDILQRVPSFATSVVVVNTGMLGADILFDEMSGETNMESEFLQLLPDSLRHINLEECGVKLLNRIAFFSIRDSMVKHPFFVGIAEITESQLVERFVFKELNPFFGFEYDNANEMYISELTNAYIKNDGNFVYVMLSENDKNVSVSTLNNVLLSDSSLLLTNARFRTLLENKAHIQGYLRSEDYKTKKFDFSEILVWNNFNDESIEIEIEVGTNNREDAKFRFISNQEGEIYKCKSNSLFSLSAILDSIELTRFLSGDDAVKRGVGSKYAGILNGKISIDIVGTDSLENKYVSYEYDENFNQTKIEKVTYDKFPVFCASFGCSKDKAHRLVRQIAVNESITDSSLLIPMVNAPVYYLIKDDNLIVSTKLDLVSQMETKTLKGLNVSVNPLSMFERANDLFPIQDTMKYELPNELTLGLIAKNDSLWSIKSKFNYKDKKAIAVFVKALSKQIK